MNMVLLFDHDFYAADKVRLKDRRVQHIKQIQRAKSGSTLEVGLLNGSKGLGQITRMEANTIEMEVTLNTASAPPLPLTLILALPRPKMLRRIISTITTLGIKKLVLINSYRVEKSYWQSPALSTENIHQYIHLGLEQAKDTIPPTIAMCKRFKPFVEDTLPELIQGTIPLVAHPKAEEACPDNLPRQVTLAVGPEGGFIPYEIEKLELSGFSSIHLGPRILTVETAIPVLAAKLFSF